MVVYCLKDTHTKGRCQHSPPFLFCQFEYALSDKRIRIAIPKGDL